MNTGKVSTKKRNNEEGKGCILGNGVFENSRLHRPSGRLFAFCGFRCHEHMYGSMFRTGFGGGGGRGRGTKRVSMAITEILVLGVD